MCGNFNPVRKNASAAFRHAIEYNFCFLLSQQTFDSSSFLNCLRYLLDIPIFFQLSSTKSQLQLGVRQECVRSLHSPNAAITYYCRNYKDSNDMENKINIKGYMVQLKCPLKNETLKECRSNTRQLQLTLVYS